MRLSHTAIILIVPLALLAFGLLTWLAYEGARGREVTRSIEVLRTVRVEAESEVVRRIDEIRETEARARDLMLGELEQPPSDLARFDALFPLRGDGSRRSADRLWTGQEQFGVGVPARGFGAFISGENVPMERKRRLLAAFDTLRAMAEGLSPSIESLYYFSTDNDLLMFAPDRADRLEFYRQKAPADLDFQDREFSLITSPRSNPEGDLRCTSLTAILYDQGGRTWTTGCMTPVRHDGEHFGAWGISIPLGSLLLDLRTDVPEVKNIIVADDGKLIRHPDFTVQASEDTAQFLDLRETDNPELQDLWTFVSESGRTEFDGYSPGLDAYVSLSRLDQPHWIVISLIPGEQVRAASFAIAMPLLLSGIVGSFAFIGLALLFINRQISKPVARLAGRADAIAALSGEDGNHADGTSSANEIERLDRAFTEMERRIEWERARLSQSFDTLVDAVSDYGMVLLDKDGRILRSNKGISTILGWPEHQHPEGLAAVFGPAGEGEWRYQQYLVHAEERGRIAEEGLRYRHDGSSFWAKDTAEPFFNSDGEAFGYAYIIRDETEERQRLLGIEESVRFLELAESIAELGHFLIDTNKRTVRLSKWVCDLFGYPRGTELPMNEVGDLIAPEDRERVNQVLGDAIEELQPFEMTLDMIDGQGRRRTAHVKADPFGKNSEETEPGEPALRGLFGIAMDITAQTEAEAKLVAARDAAEEAAETRMNLLATVSHEIRTPMTGIIGMLDQMKRDQSATMRAQSLEIIEDSAEALVRVLDDVLQHARIESGAIRMEETEFDTQDLLFRVAELFRPLARRKGIGLSVEDECRRILIGDPARIQQILANFLSNAIKFTAKGKVVLTASCEEGDQSGWVNLQFAVEDNGIGVAADRLPQLFTAFEQAEAGTEKRFGGTGLGLSICRRLAEAMDGSVFAESEEGSGSRFILQLALRQAQGDDWRRPGTGRTAAVVAPSASVQITAQALMEELGFTVEGGSDLAPFADSTAEVILFDADASDPREWENFPPSRLLALVAHDNGRSRDLLRQSGIGLLFKPLEIDQLRKALQK